MENIYINHDYIDFRQGVLSILTRDGEFIETSNHQDIKKFIQQSPTPILCHGPNFFNNTKTPPCDYLELLNLLAFIKPTLYALPTLPSLASALNIDSTLPSVIMMQHITQHLLDSLKDVGHDVMIEKLALMLDFFDCPWGKYIVAALDIKHHDNQKPYQYLQALHIWDIISKTKKTGNNHKESPTKKPRAKKHEIMDNARDFLHEYLEKNNLQIRQQQSDYSAAIGQIYDEPPEKSIMVEAATGVGKTIGYIAPSLLWAKKHEKNIWISTFTRYLQHQALVETRGFYEPQKLQQFPSPIQLRKGRENYLCLLNLEDMIARSNWDKQIISAAALIVRWYYHHQDGDFSAHHFPSWLSEIFPYHMIGGLADRRGECVHQACPHHDYCFIEQANEYTQDADVIIANHAYMIYQLFHAACPSGGRANHIEKLVVDEAHQLFHVADQFFAGELTIGALRDLRLWIVGRKTVRQSRKPRGLAKRCEGLLSDADQEIIAELIFYLGELVSDKPYDNIISGQTANSGEAFLHQFYITMCDHEQKNTDKYRQRLIYSSEFMLEGKDKLYIDDILIEKAHIFIEKLKKFQKTTKNLTQKFADLQKTLQQEISTEESDQKHLQQQYKSLQQCDSLMQQIELRILAPVNGWIDMIDELILSPEKPTQEDINATIDWAEITREQGEINDIGMFRHLRDPMPAFAHLLRNVGCDIAITSATLTSAVSSDDADILAKEKEFAAKRTGLAYLDKPPDYYQFTSPFDYATQANIILINDLPRRNRDMGALSNAFSQLFTAAGGGGMGIFTATARLKSSYMSIKTSLSKSNIPLYAQHIDVYSLANLLAIFKEDTHSCIIGTDALCDGVDVPGNGLRLIVMEHIPWPRGGLLHQQRRQYFGNRDYDMALTRLRLRQTFGRLIRSIHDKGVFVILESSLPSDLRAAFPNDVVIQQCNLNDACMFITEFFNKNNNDNTKTIAVEK